MSQKTFLHTVSDDEACRIDQVIARNIDCLSRTQIQDFIKLGFVSCNSVIVNNSRYKVKTGDLIEMHYSETKDLSWVASDVKLNILYEDEDILVIDKPAGIVMHPGAGQIINTVANALLHLYPNSTNIPRAGIIHRLDKDTSGVCICAKSNSAYLKLTKDIKDRKVKRKYKALVHGEIFAHGFIEEPIGRHPKNRVAMAVVNNGKPAFTSYKVLTKYNEFTWIELELLTGRTHQIRVHMAYIKHPIAGDKLYNKPITNYANIKPATIAAISSMSRQALHAFEIEFSHPITGKNLQFRSDVASDIHLVLKTLEQKTF